ncbi:hypothetical protein DFS33DRAFT_1272504 [Desarmillaria ectypa]|nr:hypothetical protein DFS33DRAFT_1272504 [Desarmillaria ectypa]
MNGIYIAMIKNYEISIIFPIKNKEALEKVTFWERPPKHYDEGRPWARSADKPVVTDMDSMRSGVYNDFKKNTCILPRLFHVQTVTQEDGYGLWIQRRRANVLAEFYQVKDWY